MKIRVVTLFIVGAIEIAGVMLALSCANMSLLSTQKKSDVNDILQKIKIKNLLKNSLSVFNLDDMNSFQ